MCSLDQLQPYSTPIASLGQDFVGRDPELERRRQELKHPEPRYTSGFLAKYARLAQGAETGAITNV